MGVVHPQCDGRDPQALGWIEDPLGASAFEHLPRRRPGDRQPPAANIAGVAGAGLDHQIVAVAQRDHDAAGVHQRASALGDQLEHPIQVSHAADGVGDVA